MRYRSCRAAPWQTLPGRARGPGCRGGACPRAACRPIRGGLGRSRPRRRRGIGEVHLSGLPPQLLAPGPPLSGQPAPIGYLIYSRRRPAARCDHAGAPTVIRQAQTPAIQLLQPFVATRKPLRLARASRAALVDLTRTHPPPHNPVMAVKSMQWAMTQCGNSTMAADSDRLIRAAVSRLVPRGRARADHSFMDALRRRHSVRLVPAVIIEAAARSAIYWARAMSIGLPAGMAEMPGACRVGRAPAGGSRPRLLVVDGALARRAAWQGGRDPRHGWCGTACSQAD